MEILRKNGFRLLYIISMPFVGLLFKYNKIFTGVMLIIFGVIVSFVDWMLSERNALKNQMREAYASLKLIFNITNAGEDIKARIIMYRYDDKKKKLYPFTPYYPNDNSESTLLLYGSLKKGIDVSKGIVGKTAREKKSHVYNILDCKNCTKELVSDWGFTEAEASKLRADRMSYIAYPILNNRKVLQGVLYIDSAIKNHFDEFDFSILDKSRQQLSILLKKE